MAPSIKELALEYINNHISVFSVPKPDESNGFDGKKASIKWSEFQKRIPSRDEVNSWFGNGNNNNYNLAIVTGCISRLLVFDIDGEYSRKFLFEMILPKLSDGVQYKILHSVRVRTGGGNLQIQLRYTEEDFPKGIKSWKCISFGKHDELAIKANGTYVIGPGSIGASGRTYELEPESGEKILTVTKAEVNELFDTIRNEAAAAKSKKQTNDDNDDGYTNADGNGGGNTNHTSNMIRFNAESINTII